MTPPAEPRSARPWRWAGVAVTACGPVLLLWTALNYTDAVPQDGAGTEPCLHRVPVCSLDDLASVDSATHQLAITAVVLVVVGVLLDAALAPRRPAPRGVATHPTVVAMLVLLAVVVLLMLTAVTAFVATALQNPTGAALAVIPLIGLHGAIVAIVRRSAAPARARWASILGLAGGAAVILAAIALEHPERHRVPTFWAADLAHPALLAAGGLLGLAVLVAAAVVGSRTPRR